MEFEPTLNHQNHNAKSSKEVPTKFKIHRTYYNISIVIFLKVHSISDHQLFLTYLKGRVKTI